MCWCSLEVDYANFCSKLKANSEKDDSDVDPLALALCSLMGIPNIKVQAQLDFKIFC